MVVQSVADILLFFSKRCARRSRKNSAQGEEPVGGYFVAKISTKSKINDAVWVLFLQGKEKKNNEDV